MKLIYKLLGGFLMISLLIWVSGFLAYTYSIKALIHAYIESGEALALEIMDEIDRTIYNRVEIFRAYAHDELLRAMLEESNRAFSEMNDPAAYIPIKDRERIDTPRIEATAFMHDLMSNDLSTELREKIEFYEKLYGFKVFSEVIVTNRYGANIAQTGRTSDFKQDDKDWWRIATREGFYIRDIHLDDSSETYSVNVGLRVDDREGRFIGVIKVVLNIEEAIHIMKHKARRGIHATHRSEAIRLLTKDGKIIYSNLEREKFLSDVSYLLSARNEKSGEKHRAREFSSKIIKESDHQNEIIVNYAGSAGYRDFSGLGWTLVLAHDMDELLTPTTELKKHFMAVSFFVTMLAVIMGSVLAVNISGNVRKLRNAALKIGKGNLDTAIEVKSTDEIGDLARAFQQMNDDLKTSISTRRKLTDAIRESEQKYRTLFESAGDAIVTLGRTDDGLVFTDCNSRTLEMFGCAYKDIINQSPLSFSPPVQPDGMPSPDKLQMLSTKALQNPTSSFEWRHIRASKEQFDVEVKISAVELGSGKQLLAVIRDITKRKQMQRDLESMNDELARSNSELQQFAYIASHDLQEPLRKITTFSGRLKDKFASSLGKEGIDYIDRMQNATERMNGLIDGLLKYSRITTKGKPFEPVDLGKVAAEVMTDLEVCIERSGGSVVTSDLPTVRADPLQMRQLLQNLISNALKFHKENDVPAVTVHGGTFNGGPDKYCQITVEDNGVGFDDKNAGRIFGVFQRLHGRSEYEGSGIGLAVCKKIVERHGGRISAKSKPGEGAKFIVTLPADQRAGSAGEAE